MMDVIIPAAWNAIVLDGYDMSRLLGRPVDVAGGMCALCNKHSVVLVMKLDNDRGRGIKTY